MTLQSIIENKISTGLAPCYLDVVNDGKQHGVEADNESFFKVIIVSNKFSGQRLANRHKAITALLRAELASHIQGLALHTYTEKEWLDYYADDFITPSHKLTSFG